MPSMGRRPTKQSNLPPKIRARAKAGGVLWYYYDTGGKPRRELPLGNDYASAVRKWAELEADKTEVSSQLITFKHAADRLFTGCYPHSRSTVSCTGQVMPMPSRKREPRTKPICR